MWPEDVEREKKTISGDLLLKKLNLLKLINRLVQHPHYIVK